VSELAAATVTKLAAAAFKFRHTSCWKLRTSQRKDDIYQLEEALQIKIHSAKLAYRWLYCIKNITKFRRMRLFFKR
jgi:hypothetical protein